MNVSCMKLGLMPVLSAAVVAWSTMARAEDQTTVSTLAEPEPERLPAAPAKPPDGLGTRGQVYLDDLVGLRASTLTSPSGGALGAFGYSGLLGFQSSKTEVAGQPSGAAMTTSAFWVAPSIDWFVTDRVSLGGSFRIEYTRSEVANAAGSSRRGSRVAARPRIGYVLPLGDSVFLWPRVGFGYDVSRDEPDSNAGSDVVVGNRRLSRLWSANAELGLALRLGRHIVFNIGPELSYIAGSYDEAAVTSSALVALGGRSNLGLVF